MDEREHSAADFEQIRIAKIIFEWWWQVSRRNLFPPDMLAPLWEDAIPEAQAFWMEGAWRMRALEIPGTLITTELVESTAKAAEQIALMRTRGVASDDLVDGFLCGVIHVLRTGKPPNVQV